MMWMISSQQLGVKCSVHITICSPTQTTSSLEKAPVITDKRLRTMSKANGCVSLPAGRQPIHMRNTQRAQTRLLCELQRHSAHCLA